MINKVFMALVIITLTAIVGQAQLLTTSCEPYGSISIKGEPASDNIPVVAYINGQEVARCTTLSGQYALIIPKDNPDTGEKEGWTSGDIIIIQVNGTEVSPNLDAQQGRIRHDLVLYTLDVKLDTWGKIKALFK